jgi:hypothetical protein
MKKLIIYLLPFVLLSVSVGCESLLDTDSDLIATPMKIN